MRKIKLPPKSMISAPMKTQTADDPEITNMMLDARYLRQSSSLIQDALQKGFDVLQLANGDIVTTGTKTVVYQYKWDDEKGKLVRSKQPDANRKNRRSSAPEIAEDEMESEEN